MGNRPLGPFGIDPLDFSLTLFILLILFLLYLLLPRGFRVHYFHSYPKRYAWSARPRRNKHYKAKKIISDKEKIIVSGKDEKLSIKLSADPIRYSSGKDFIGEDNNIPNAIQKKDESQLVSTNMDLSNTMKKLRNIGILIVAHGSRGKPKTVRLQLGGNSLTWRTETKKNTTDNYSNESTKLGKIHSVTLKNILYVDIGKHTTALRRLENASVSESLCFSLFTKEGSLDLEANSLNDRDALVRCFSLVLDEVHKQKWRDLYRSSSSLTGEHIQSSFDEYEDDVVLFTNNAITSS